MLDLWFHSFNEDGSLKWQGQIVQELSNDQYLVQLYSWTMGEPSTKHIISLSDMKSWTFFNSNEEMVEAGNSYLDRQIQGWRQEIESTAKSAEKFLFPEAN